MAAFRVITVARDVPLELIVWQRGPLAEVAVTVSGTDGTSLVNRMIGGRAVLLRLPPFSYNAIIKIEIRSPPDAEGPAGSVSVELRQAGRRIAAFELRRGDRELELAVRTIAAFTQREEMPMAEAPPPPNSEAA